MGIFPTTGATAKPVLRLPRSSPRAGNHGVCICGYDDNANPGGSDADHKGGFKMVNSWGPTGTGQPRLRLPELRLRKGYVYEAWSMGDLAPDGPSISSLSSGNGRQITISGHNFGTLRRSAGVTFSGSPRGHHLYGYPGDRHVTFRYDFRLSGDRNRLGWSTEQSRCRSSLHPSLPLPSPPSPRLPAHPVHR